MKDAMKDTTKNTIKNTLSDSDADDTDKTMDILQRLSKEPYRFDFYQAVRHIECQHNDKPRLGETLRPSDDSIRFGQQPSMIFAPSSIASIQLEKNENNNNELIRMQVYFFGMFGPNGALPLHLTQYTQDRQRTARDEALGHFIDIFHHRLLSLFYRTWANKEPTVHYDRPDEDRFHHYLGAMLGIGSPALQNRDAMHDNSKLHYAGHLSAQTRHAEGLTAILQAFFNVPVRLTECVGEWLTIPKQSRCYLGINNEGGTLNEDAVLGGKSWQRQYKFSVHIGPMKLTEYEALLPKKKKHKQIATLIKNYLGLELTWDLNLILNKHDIPKTRLGQYGQLGWSSWLHNQPPRIDASDFVTS